MTTQPVNQSLSTPLRMAVGVTAVIDLLIGLAFLFGPELNLNLWPTPIGIELKRFIGAIIVANGFGAAMIARQGSWEGARVLFAVALIYGIAVFAMLLYDLALGVAVPFFWIYIALDAIFLVPIAYIYWYHERAR
jgi:hypothetical protein